jgi:multicomponent Na+:H+ antiporter subunit F
MSAVFLWATLITLFLMMPFVSRVITGPTVFDRVVALNGLGTLVPASLVLVGLLYDRVDMFVDLALGLFLLNVFTTLLVAQYVRKKVDET